MSFFSGRFDPLDKVDEEVANIYRSRDNDKGVTPAEKVDKSQFYNNDIDNPALSFGRQVVSKPTDSIWNRMTESERLENGFPTKFYLFTISPVGIAFAGLMAGIGHHYYSKIYYPGGIVLRRQRTETAYTYLK